MVEHAFGAIVGSARSRSKLFGDGGQAAHLSKRSRRRAGEGEASPPRQRCAGALSQPLGGDCAASRSEATKTALPTGDPRRSAYCINKKNFGSDREGLEQDEDNIIRLATADALPGLKPEKLAAA